MHKLHQNFLATSLKYGSYLSVALFAVGFVLNVFVGSDGHQQCMALPALLLGIFQGIPLCWYALGAYALLVLPVLTLVLITILAMQSKNFPLALMAILVFVLILGASFIPH